MDKPIRIRAEDGSVVDLAERRRALVRQMIGDDNACVRAFYLADIAIIDALVAALSVERMPEKYNTPYEDERYNAALDHVAEAARVVEE